MKSTTPRFLLKPAFLLVCFWGLITSDSFGQTYVNGDYQSVATGTWATATTWQKFVGGAWAATGVNPAPTTGYTAGTIYIQTGTTVTVAAGISEGYLYINGGSLSINSGITFTVANGTNSNDLNIVSGSVINNGTLSLATASIGVSNSGTLTNNSGGTVNMNGTGTTITNNAGAVLTNSGTMLNGGTNVLTNNGTINNNSAFTNNGTLTNNNAINNAGTFTQNSTTFTNAVAGVLTNYSTFTINSLKTLVNNGTIVNATGVINSGLPTYGTLTFNNGSLYQHNFSSAAATAGTVPNATWAVGSICEIIACGNSGNGPTNLSQTFSDFTWNNSTQTLDINLNAQLGTVRNLTIKNTNNFNMVLRASSSGIPAVTTVSGDLVILPAGNLVLTNGDAGYSTSNHTLNVAGNYTQTGGRCALTICSSNTNTPVSGGTGTLNIAGNLNFSAGTLNICSSTIATGCVTGTASGILNVTGNCSISGGTVSVCSSTVTGGGGTGTMNITGSFAHTAGMVTKTGANTGVININGTALQTIESIGFSAATNLGFNVQQSGSGTTTILAGKTFVLNSNTTFTLYDNLSVATDFTINGTFATNTNTWALNTTPIASLTEVFGRFKNTSATIGTSDSTTLKIRSGGVFEHAVNGGFIAVAAWHALSILDVTGTTTATSIANDNQLFGQILWESGAQTASTTFGTTGFGVQTDYNVFDTGPLAPGTGRLRFPDFDFTIGSSPLGGDLYVNNTAKLQVSNAPLLYTTNYRTITINGNLKLGFSAFIYVGTPDASATATQASNKARNYVFAIKKNFYNYGGHLYSYDHKSYNGANNDEEYRLVLNFNGGITQSLEEGESGVYALTTLSGNGVANDATTDEFVLDTYPYKIMVSGANTKLQPGAANTVFPFNTLTVGGVTATADTLNFGTLSIANNLIHFSVLDSTGAKQYASTTVFGSSVLDMGLSQLIEAAADTSSVKLLSLAEIRTKHAGGISATAATGCLQHTGSRATLNANANYTYYGSAAQNTGNALPATITGVLEIANTTALASGGVTLTRATAVSGASGTRSLSLISGRLITTATNLITVGNGSVVTPAGGSAVSFVDGPIRKVGVTAAVPFVYPTGDTAKWARIAITSASTVAAADFTAEYNKRDPHTAIDTTQDWPNLKRFSYQEYWKLVNNTGTTPAVTVKLYWEDATFSGITSATSANLRIAHYRSTGPKWYDQAGASVTLSSAGSTGSIVMTTTVGATLTTASTPYFTFGGPNLVNPLPIELLNFDGQAESNGNMLNWITATETNNDHFELERSMNANDFTKIATVSGNGNSTSALHYEQLDALPFKGINYYRLKQVDFDGKYTYSEIIAIENNSMQNIAIDVYPNPSNDLVHINTSGSISSLIIYNMLGEIVYSSTGEQSNTIDFTPLTNGVYIIKALGTDGTIVQKRFVKQ